MLTHDYQNMPGRSTEVGDNFNEETTILRCKWCMKTPMKAREDGCPIRELQETGTIPLRIYNPDGVEYFKDRTCVTCGKEIMGHLLKRNSDAYWCDAWLEQASEGITGCKFDVEGIEVPNDFDVK